MAQHAGTGSTDAAQRPRHRTRLAALLALTVATGLAATLLALRALALVDTLPSPRFEAYLEIPLVGAGCLLAAWVAATSGLGAACVLLHAGGRRWAAAERLVLRHAPAVVRRLTGAGVALSVGAGLALGAGSAHAAEATPPADATVVELGWRSTTETGAAIPDQRAQRPTSVTPSSAGPADVGSPVTPPADRAQEATPAAPDTGATAPAGPTSTSRGTPSDQPVPAQPVERADSARPGPAPDAASGARPSATAQDASGQDIAPTPDPDGFPRNPTDAMPHVPLSSLLGGGGPQPSTPQEAASPQGPPHSDPSPATTPPQTAEPAASTVSVVVLRGDCLWSLAERALGPGATDAQITAEWQRWYAANADIIGPDPGLISPGQILQAPRTV